MLRMNQLSFRNDRLDRFGALEGLWSAMASTGSSVAGVGSRAWLDSKDIITDSDYDFVVVSSDWSSILPLIFGRDVRLPEEFDCVAVRKLSLGEASFGCVIFSPATFLLVSESVSGTIRYFRPVDSKTQHLLCSVRGDRKWASTPEHLVLGGRVSDVPLAIQEGSDYFIGPVRESLLSCPVILDDSSGVLKQGVRSHFAASAQGLRDAGFPRSDGSVLLRGLSRAERLSTWARVEIANFMSDF